MRRRPHVRAQPHSGAHVLTRVCIRTHGRAPACQRSPCSTLAHTLPHIFSHIQAHAFTQICIHTHTGVHTHPHTGHTCARTSSNTRQSGLTMHSVLTHLHPQTSTVHTHTDPVFMHVCPLALQTHPHTYMHLYTETHMWVHIFIPQHVLTCSKGSHPYALPQTHTHTP